MFVQSEDYVQNPSGLVRFLILTFRDRIMSSKQTIWSNNTIIPPKMFSYVTDRICRSNLFGTNNFPFIKSLNLKNIVYLGDGELGEDILSFCTRENIQVVGNEFD